MKNGYSDKERDAFWDIGKLLPRRTPSRSPSPVGSVPLPTVGEERPTPPEDASRRITARPRLAGEVRETVYTPADNPLIRSVTVRQSTGDHSFYAQFLRDAARYYDAPGTPCEYVPFFSFTPQYNQLSPDQLAYYFYLRSEVRAGRYPRIDKGYFFLLVYEVVHLPDRLPPEEGSRLLAALWGAYRRELDGIDRYMIPWLSDYCLLHGVPCPRDLSADCLAAAGECEGTEFYFGTAAEATPEGVLRLLSLSSDYRFEGGRAITAENRTHFFRHVTGAMERVFRHLFMTGAIAPSDRPERLVRRAFSGSLCSHNVRAEITLEYLSLRRSEGWRRTVTQAVKYAENCVRAALGIRARLSVPALPDAVRAVIDGYFAAVRSSLPRRSAAPPAPAYERLYDAPDRGFDATRAAAIEASSWALTRRLVEESPAEAEPPAPPVTAAPPAPVVEPVAEAAPAAPAVA
ncbi:MAG: TerB N-terminal domain-containing protein, partial [Clostridia bacterium]|nr:TerB N-terminal domain-containing protein [Clostridia bacterium]